MLIRISFSISTNTKPFGIVVGEQVRQPGRQEEEEAHREQEREGDRAEPGAAADVLLVALLVGRHLGVRRDAERAEADLERLGERHHAAHDRQRAARGGASSTTRAARRSPRSRPSRPPSSRRRRPGAAPRTACAPPRPRWRCRASSRPRERPGLRRAHPSWPPEVSLCPSYRRSADVPERGTAELARVVRVRALRDGLLRIRLEPHEAVHSGPRMASERRSPRPSEAIVTVSTTLPSTVRRTGTSVAAALPVFVTTPS